MPPRKPTSKFVSGLTLPAVALRDHLADADEDYQLERWTKLGEAVLAHGTPNESHISEMIELARDEQNEIQRRVRRSMRLYRHGKSKSA